jgi:hypothetical protein
VTCPLPQGAPGSLSDSASVATKRTRTTKSPRAGGDVVPNTDLSYLVAVRGNFTPSGGPGLSLDLPGLDNSIPAEQSYSVMTLVIDAATGDVTDTGYSDDFPNLSAAGTPVRT